VEITVGPSEPAAVAHLIVEWYENSRRSWLEFEHDV
jgi:hypothetical protein